MRTIRTLTVGVLLTALASFAAAQFDGPAPLAWRWLQPTKFAPSGAPLVEGTTVYTAVGGRVFALDKDSGNLKWRFPAVDPIEGVFKSAPVSANGLIIAIGDNKIAYGIDPATGQSKWSLTLPTSTFGQPVLVGDLLVFEQTDNKLNSINVKTGQFGWTAPYNVFDGIQGQLGSFKNDVLFFTNKNELVSLDSIALKSSWRQRFSQLPPNVTPTIYGDSVYINSGPFLIALNANTGLGRWQKSAQFQLAYSPAASPEGVLVVSTEGKAFLYDHNGQITAGFKKPIDMGTLPANRPSAAGTKFIVPTSVGGIALIDPKTGSILWSYLMRPVGEAYSDSGNRPGGNGGRGGAGGGGGVPGGGGGATPGGQRIYTVQPSGPAVLAGNTLLVPAKDGSIFAFDKDLGVDLTSPAVKMLFPNAGEQVSSAAPFTMFFNIEDEASGINESTLKIEIDGAPYEYKFGKDGIAIVSFSMASKTNKPLTDGRKKIVLTVSDWMGNITKQEFALTIDNSLRPVVLPGSQPQNGVGGGRPGGGAGGKGGGGSGGDNG